MGTGRSGLRALRDVIRQPRPWCGPERVVPGAGGGPLLVRRTRPLRRAARPAAARARGGGAAEGITARGRRPHAGAARDAGGSGPATAEKRG